MKKNIKTITASLLAVILCFCVTISSFSVEAVDEETDSDFYGVIPDDYEISYPDYDIVGSPEAMASSYDPRTTNGITSVKNQTQRGVCWAFSTMATLESAVYKKTGLKTDYSEEALRFAVSNETKNILGKKADFGYYGRGASAGSHMHVGENYITSINSAISADLFWLSPNLETDVPFVPLNYDNGTLLPDTSVWPSSIATSYSNAYASGTKHISLNKLKEAIIEYGGACLTFSANRRYLNSETAAYNNREFDDDSFHAVEVVGWDDNYSKTNFASNCIPNNDGAWLIKNSWGSDWGNDGYGWISYEDVSLLQSQQCYVVSDVLPISKNEYTLSYDYISSHKKKYINMVDDGDNTAACISNVYDVSDLKTNYGKINKVMFYSNNIGLNYYVYIVQSSNNNITMPQMSELGDNYLAEGTVDHEGYITASFPNSFTLNTSTKKIAVIVKFVDKSDYSLRMCTLVEQYAKFENLYEYDPAINYGESFYYDGTWHDFKNESTIDDKHENGNFCIRPTLVKRDDKKTTEDSTLNKYNLTYQRSSIYEYMNLNGNLLYSITCNGNLMMEDKDFTRSGSNNSTVTIKKSFLSNAFKDSNNNPVEQLDIVFTFTDGEPQTLTVYPYVSTVSASGKYGEGHTLSAHAMYSGDFEIPADRLDYQWMYSENGTSWIYISGATSSTYTLTEDDFMRYIGVGVCPKNYEGYSKSYTISPKPATKVVLFGDANLDHEISIRDASEVQLAVAQLTTPFNDEQKLAADVDGDGEVTINDASLIQLYLSQNISDFPVNET